MKKQTGKERVKKEWCYGIDLRILVALSLEDECWEFIQRITEDNVGDCYLISNMGRVYDCNKQLICEIYPDTTRGYNTVSLQLCPEGFRNFKVHRLVAMAFVPNPDPKSKCVVHHINSVRTDNRAENLLWVSTIEHKALHTLKANDELRYYQLVEDMRKAQPIKSTDSVFPFLWTEAC